MNKINLVLSAVKLFSTFVRAIAASPAQSHAHIITGLSALSRSPSAIYLF
ncbi:MAG: hypothetical protein JST21_17100 [Bacteroidetes bacterium]|nr:hypothetical protein [Bacteroidota bacterium]